MYFNRLHLLKVQVKKMMTVKVNVNKVISQQLFFKFIPLLEKKLPIKNSNQDHSSKEFALKHNKKSLQLQNIINIMLKQEQLHYIAVI